MLILHKDKERITNSRDGKNSKVDANRGGLANIRRMEVRSVKNFERTLNFKITTVDNPLLS